jgi:hypothetical protein
MKVEIDNIESVEHILQGYSGRRLQYAIRMGILPTPEMLSQLLNKKMSTINRIPKAQPITKAKLASQVTNKTVNRANAMRRSATFSQVM